MRAPIFWDLRVNCSIKEPVLAKKTSASEDNIKHSQLKGDLTSLMIVAKQTKNHKIKTDPRNGFVSVITEQSNSPKHQNEISLISFFNTPSTKKTPKLDAINIKKRMFSAKAG